MNAVCFGCLDRQLSPLVGAKPALAPCWRVLAGAFLLGVVYEEAYAYESAAFAGEACEEEVLK